MDFRALSSMPWIHLFASPACNLNCEYCTQHTIRTNKISSDFLENHKLLEFINQIPPTSFYISGGEPLIHPGIKDFVKIAGQHGHKIAIDTNISVPLKDLEHLIEQWDPEYLSFINISHHAICNISLDYIMERVKLLKQAGVGNFVKYVGVPELLGQIEQNIRILKEEGIGATATILQGNWKGRILPKDYTLDEVYRLFNLIALNTSGLQIFDGIYSKGIPCRGGNDFITYNMHNDKKVNTCCHGGAFPLSLSESFFMTGKQQRIPCKIKQCLGDLMFIFGINGVTDEIEKFHNLCHGEYEFCGPERVVKFVNETIRAGYPVVNISKFLDVSDHLSKYQKQQQMLNISSSVSAPKKTLTHSVFKTKHGDELIDELESYINQWENAEEVIAANFEYASKLNSERNKFSISEPALEARALAKKVLQFRFGLPLKCNIEAISTCILKCEFCILKDLKKYRRKVRMTYEDFLKVWRYMEPFTTEVEFTGGEPLLNKDVFSMIAEARKTGVHTTLTTNAQLLDEKSCDKILDIGPSRILIAYDSVDADTYESVRVKADFGRLKKNISYLCSQKRERRLKYPKVHLQMVINRKNVDDIISYWQDAVELGADSALLKPLFVWPNSDPQTKQKMIDEYLIPGNPLSYHDVSTQGELMDTRKPGICPNMQQVHIGSGSEVIPCWYRLQETYKAGFCADRPFIDIWFSDEYVEYRRRMEREEVAEGCRRCIGIYNPRLFIKKEIDELKMSWQLHRLCLESEEFMRQGLYSQALEKLDEVAAVQPLLPRLHYVRAFILSHMEQKNNREMLSAIQSELAIQYPNESATELLDHFIKYGTAGDPQKMPIISDSFEILDVPFLNAVVANPQIGETVRIINKHLSRGDYVQAKNIIETHLSFLPESSVVLSQIMRRKESDKNLLLKTGNIVGESNEALTGPKSGMQQCVDQESVEAFTVNIGIKPAAQEAKNTGCTTISNVKVKDEKSLITHILRENPRLAESLSQRRILDSVFILREWVSRTANICSAELKFAPQDPISAFNVFANKKGGVWCGGVSQFFVMILRLFGIPAATYGYSVKDVEWLSHCTTLFCDVTRHDTPVYQVDAYLNYHFSDTATGEMLEFCELVQRIKGKEYDRIKLMESTVKRSYLTRPGDTWVGRWLYPGVEEIEEMPLDHKQEDVWIYKDASPSLLTWIPTRPHSRWNEANRIMAGRSLEQFMLDMMLCNPVYGSFGSTKLNERFRKRVALAYQSLEDCEVNSYRVEPNKGTEKMKDINEQIHQPLFGRQESVGTACATKPKILVEPQQESSITIPSVPVQRLHEELGFARIIDYPQSSLNKPLEQWKMEVDDAPIFRYIYRNFRPRRHLEFGTWQGTGTMYCLEECDATVWTINLPGGENKSNGLPAYSLYPDELASAREWAERIGMAEQDSYRTDCLGFIGRFYLEKGLGSRVCQIYGDSTKWDISNYPPGFFDTALIDGGHKEDVVITDTAKAFELLRSGGLIMWHDFCPPIYDKFETTLGVMRAIHQQWEWINEQTLKLFWIYPSWILVGVKK